MTEGDKICTLSCESG